MEIRIKTKKIEIEIKTRWHESLSYSELIRMFEMILMLDDKVKFENLIKFKDNHLKNIKK